MVVYYLVFDFMLLSVGERRKGLTKTPKSHNDIHKLNNKSRGRPEASVLCGVKSKFLSQEKRAINWLQFTRLRAS